MGQRRLFEEDDGTAPGEVWDELPAAVQKQATLQLARLMLRLWHQPAPQPNIPSKEGHQNGL